jgi:hypothetical protein
LELGIKKTRQVSRVKGGIAKTLRLVRFKYSILSFKGEIMSECKIKLGFYMCFLCFLFILAGCIIGCFEFNGFTGFSMGMLFNGSMHSLVELTLVKK